MAASPAVISWAAAALGAPGTERDAWPALPLEQPVVVSRGWWVFDAAVADRDGAARAEGAARFGVARGWEASVTQRFGPDGAAAPLLGARVSLGAREAPSASLALTGHARPPWGSGGGAGGAGVAAALVTAPFRWSAAAAGGRAERGWTAEAEVGSLLQLGPLAPFGSLRWGPEPAGSAGLQVNGSRGVALLGAWSRPLRPGGARVASLGLRIAL